MSTEIITTTSTSADGKTKVKKVVKKKKVTIDEGGLNGSRRESEVTIEEVTNTSSTTGPRKSSKELIFSDEATRAMDKDWHSNHFNCWQCDESLVAQRYVTKEEHSYCIRCYEPKFCSQCDECNQIIGIDSKDLSYREKHWHEACFNCTKCGNSLVDKSFGAKSEKLYCVDCYDELFAVRCEGCNAPFKSGTKKLEYKGHQWHEQCFLCDGCKVPIGSNPFVPKESENFCSKCYEDRFANKCTKCTGVISTGGVTYQNSHFHTECLLCNNCNVQLAGQRFSKTPDGRMLCTECVCTLFARKCAACPNPIAGGSGIKFIAFEERNWHHDCFNCIECKTSLVGRGFMTEGQDIICSDCAKAKLAAA